MVTIRICCQTNGSEKMLCVWKIWPPNPTTVLKLRPPADSVAAAKFKQLFKLTDDRYLEPVLHIMLRIKTQYILLCVFSMPLSILSSMADMNHASSYEVWILCEIFHLFGIMIFVQHRSVCSKSA